MSAVGNATRARTRFLAAIRRLVEEHGVPNRFFSQDVAAAGKCSLGTAASWMRHWSPCTVDVPGFRGAIEVRPQIRVEQRGVGSKGLRNRSSILVAESNSCLSAFSAAPAEVPGEVAR